MDNPEKVKAALEQTFQDPGLVDFNFCLEINSDRKLVLRFRASGGGYSWPVEWTLAPARVRFADASKRQNFPGIWVAPHIADPLARDLRRWGIGHADLNGRLFLKTESLLVDRAPHTKNAAFKDLFKAQKSDPQIFTRKSSRIVRALLSRISREWTQEELEAFTFISRGYVSRITSVLEQQGYIRRQGKGGRSGKVRYQLVDWQRLLDDWAESDKFRARVEKLEFSLLESDASAIARQARDVIGKDNLAFTQWYAAWLRHPHAIPPVVSAYVTSAAAWQFKLGRKVQDGGNLWLLIPRDQGVFQGKQTTNDLPLVCDAQIYLDLVDAGLRGPEAATELRQWEGFSK